MQPGAQLSLLLLAGIIQVSAVRADSFGSGANAFDIEFVTIGSPNNLADTTGSPNPAGAVSYVYRIGKFEVSESMINKANTEGGLSITHMNFAPNKPASLISWGEAARFVNWLNAATGHSPAYKLAGSDSLQHWTATDPGFDPQNPIRNTLSKYFLPNADEWYKAAFYDPINSLYYDFAIGSDAAPTSVVNGTAPGTAVYGNNWVGSVPADITSAGGLSPFGTMAQGDNVGEWEEAVVGFPDHRPIRIGSYWNTSPSGSRSRSPAVYYTASDARVGFRVASRYEQLSGDFNQDGYINGRDFLAWQRNPSIGSLADWQDHYSSPDIATLAVPEPCACGLLWIVATALIGRCR